MAVFDASFANKKTGKAASNYGILVDQLDILEQNLSSDGKLSPGDYLLLNKKAQEIYGHPGLSPANRSNIEVKMARYTAESKKVALKDRNDISQLGREVDDTARTNSVLLGGSPTKFLQAQEAMYRTQIAQLSDAVNSLDAAGDDSSAHINELNAALAAYGDTREALDYVKNHQAGEKPQSGYVAYITTNQQGEMTNVEITREGSKTGYLETNGLYGGLKIYGKLNRKDNGENVFLLGSKQFKAADVLIPGPDGTFKSNVLIDSSVSQPIGPGLTKAQGTSYVEVDPSSLKTQSSVRPGSWVEGDKGFLYKKEGDGSYTKYVNADRAQLGISDNDIIKMPRSYEQNAILPVVKQTIDASTVQPTMAAPIGVAAPFTTTAPDFSRLRMAQPGTSAPAAPGALGRPSTGAPTERAPQRAQGIAGRAIGAAKGYLAGLFSGGR